MLQTKFCELFGIEYPIVSAGMGGVASAELAAAVSEAGGLGTIGLAGFSPNAIHHEIERARRLTKKPLAVNLLVPFLRPGVIEQLVEEPIQAVTFFWGEPDESLARLRQAGIRIIWQCGSLDDVRAAIRAGADVIMAQGVEAGGHVRGTVTTLAFIPEVRDAIGPDMPLLAAGGIADGRSLVAALALGADGAVFGTRFVASQESAAHPAYKQRIVEAHADETVYTTLYDVGWPDAPHRVLRTKLLDKWESAGRPESGRRPGEGEQVGVMRRADVEFPLVRYSVAPPMTYVDGDPEAMALYAGQSCGVVNDLRPAGEIVKRIASEAHEIIKKRLVPLAL